MLCQCKMYEIRIVSTKFNILTIPTNVNSGFQICVTFSQDPIFVVGNIRGYDERT